MKRRNFIQACAAAALGITSGIARSFGDVAEPAPRRSVKIISPRMRKEGGKFIAVCSTIVFDEDGSHFTEIPPHEEVIFEARE